MDSGGVYPGLPLRESNNPCARPHIRLFRRGADGASLYGVSICGSRKDYCYYTPHGNNNIQLKCIWDNELEMDCNYLTTATDELDTYIAR